MTRNIDICFVHQSVYYPSYEVSKKGKMRNKSKKCECASDLLLPRTL